MISGKKSNDTNGSDASYFGKYLRFGRSIYGRVVLIIALLSIFLSVSFSVIFRSVYQQHLNTVILQSGNNVGSLVEGALYHSMLENDKGALQSTLDVIHTMPGIEDVHMYDSDDSLVYSSYPSDTFDHFNPNCKSCHTDLATMFPLYEKSYRIITAESECLMSKNENGQRHLMIRSPILNSKSCYESNVRRI
jgi:two-component system NtrC family sensor kinase